MAGEAVPCGAERSSLLQRMPWQYKTAGDGCTWLKSEDYDEVLGNALDLPVLPV